MKQKELEEIFAKATKERFVCPKCNHHYAVAWALCPKCGKIQTNAERNVPNQS